MSRVIVIGAGVVGLAVAQALARRGSEVVVCERRSGIAQETSSRNSGVLHAGLYYPEGSQKAVLCVEGRERLARFLPEHGVEHRWVGKLIVACEATELPELERIHARAQACGAVPLVAWSQADIVRRFPAVRAIAGLWSAGTGIVDAHGLAERLKHIAQAHDAMVLCGRTVVAAEQNGNALRLGIQAADAQALEWLETDAVVNAAGLGADVVAQLPGTNPNLPQQRWVKGNWFALRGPAPVDALVYPVPAPHLLGLGTHLTVDLAGRARLGPDTEPVTDPSDLQVDPARAEAFARAAQRFLPQLKAEDLHPDQAGIRPKLALDRFADFHIARRAELPLPWIDLLGIESPGLTACLAIAERVAALLA